MEIVPRFAFHHHLRAAPEGRDYVGIRRGSIADEGIVDDLKASPNRPALFSL